MAQWGQGYQYPLQTGFNPQQQQSFQQPGFQPGIAPQPTGFPGQQRPVGFQQPQQTGFPGAQGFQQPQQQPGGIAIQPTGFQPLQAQPTGFQQPNAFQRRPPPPVPPIPSQFQQNASQPSAFLSTQPTSRFLSPSPGPLTAQPTGFGGGLQPLVPQVTGFVDPRLQMMSSTFLPANPSMPYNPAGAPQLQQQQSGFSLQQSFQQHNAQRGTTAPKVPWALSKAEKKSYDQIFRAWDQRSEGFITGQTALEVFGQSGLDKNDLAKIWSLADADNRGKLNLAEFHVAMGLIYRRLNGNEIPDELPPELVPPSHRDLDNSVNFLKDILKNDTRARSPSNFDSGPVSKLKERSFNSTSAPGAGGRQDATVYKYNDETPAGGFYQPRSRHVDRSAIRTDRERDSPSSDLSDMKRQLENTARMLDRNTEKEATRTAEDEELDREMEDLRYRVKRVQEDLDYVSKGPRSHAKDEERRNLERELLSLMHERLPELERKIQDREERLNREKREWNRERDRRNERSGRYDDRDRNDQYSSSRYHERDRGYSSYDRDRDYGRNDRDRDYGQRPYSRTRDRDDYDRPRSPPTTRRSPPPPPPAPTSSISKPPPPAPAPAASPAPTLKKMTPEEREAFMQAETQRRIQERMVALGLRPSASPTPKLDTSVEDRLAKEKKEAEEKAKAAEKEAEEREKARQERLAALKGESTPSTPTATSPSVPAAASPAAPVEVPKPTPPPVKARAPAPPPPRKAPAPRPPVAPKAPPAPPAPVIAPPPPAPEPTAPEIDPIEEQLRAREAALRKAREERLERLRKLEEEEAAEAKRMEEEYQARRRQFASPAVPAPAPLVPDVASPPPPPPPPAPPAPVQSPPTPPPAPAPPAVSPPVSKTNPFSRLMQETSAPATPTSTGVANGGTNPFFKSQAASTLAPAPPAAVPAAPPPPRATSIPPPSKSPAPPAVKTSYHTAPESDDDWGDIEEKEDDDSSEDELDSSRDTRNKLAQQLFGSILPPSRPQSAAPPSASARSAVTPPPAAAAPPPPPPSAPPALDVTGSVPAPPPPPPAPPASAPSAPSTAAPAPSGDRSALLSAIQGGARLRKTTTNDRSGAALSGKVVGDSPPPEHINTTVQPLSPPVAAVLQHPALGPAALPSMENNSSSRSNRESVDWYAGLAADSGALHSPQLPSMKEEEEEPEAPHAVPDIQVEDTDPLQDVDRSVEYRVRSLYPYEGQRAEDLSFGENLILTAHPSKSGAEWWYGTLIRDGKSGFFPQTYVEKVELVKATALYPYESSNPDELPFAEGDELSIVDRSDSDWWKVEQGGVVFIVPAAYLELHEG